MPDEIALGYDPTKLDLSTIGVTGLKRYAGRVYEEWLPELSGDKWLRVLREMIEQDPVIGGMCFANEMLTRQVDFTWRPADRSNAAHAVAQHFNECMEDMSDSRADTMAEIVSFIPWGFSYFEVVQKIRGGMDAKDGTTRSKYNDGRIGWRKWSIRSQDTKLRWEFDEEGGIQGYWQQAPPRFIPTLIPIEKALLFRTKPRKNNPEGVSALRSAYRPWFIKKRIENLEAVGVERDTAGMPIGWIPPEYLHPEATPAQVAVREAIKKAVTNLRRDEQEGMVMPLAYDEQGHKLFDLTLLQSGGARQFDTNPIITRLDQRIAMTAMADFILLGHTNVGTEALADTKTSLYSDALGAYLDIACETITKHAAPKLVKLNQWPTELTPTLARGDVAKVDLVQLANFVLNLSRAGMPLFPNVELQRWLMEQAGMPVPTQAHTQGLEQAIYQLRSGPPVEDPNDAVQPSAHVAPRGTTPGGGQGNTRFSSSGPEGMDSSNGNNPNGAAAF